jgi:hypothetical protein
MGVVQEQRRRLSATLRAYIARHDALRERELDDALRRCQANLARWMEVSGPRARTTVDLDLPSHAVGHLKQKFYNPSDHIPPPPLTNSEPEAADPVSLEQLRQQGGPSLEAFRDRIAAMFSAGAGGFTAGEVFASAPACLRRPVEILGLVHVAAGAGAKEPQDPGDTELFEAMRPDGTQRSFLVPALTFTQPQRTEPESNGRNGTAGD